MKHSIYYNRNWLMYFVEKNITKTVNILNRECQLQVNPRSICVGFTQLGNWNKNIVYTRNVHSCSHQICGWPFIELYVLLYTGIHKIVFCIFHLNFFICSPSVTCYSFTLCHMLFIHHISNVHKYVNIFPSI